MDFTVRTRALNCSPPHLRFAFMRRRLTPATTWLTQHADLARSLLRGPRSDVYHLHPGLDLSLRFLQPMRDTALRRTAFGLLLQQPV
jgi:hypothetical protein